MKKTLIVFGVLFVIFIVINGIINRQIADVQKETPPRVVRTPVPKPVIRKKTRYDDVVRKVRWEPNRKFEQNIFLIDGQEVARFKNIREKIFDIEGVIPDGEVKFERKSKGTYGYEHYSNGKRHGPYVEYYDNGQVAREADYYQGKRISVRDYYYDGTLRMEENVFDALLLCDDPEAGWGKTYYRDGTLMYEWALTNELDGGYKRSYNVKGELTEEKIYDDRCEIESIVRP